MLSQCTAIFEAIGPTLAKPDTTAKFCAKHTTFWATNCVTFDSTHHQSLNTALKLSHIAAFV